MEARASTARLRGSTLQLQAFELIPLPHTRPMRAPVQRPALHSRPDIALQATVCKREALTVGLLLLLLLPCNEWACCLLPRACIVFGIDVI